MPARSRQEKQWLHGAWQAKRFAQGDRFPAGFRTDNLPAAYADQYRDTDSSLYRYSSGNVYRVDRLTQRIAEVIKLPTL